MYILTIKKYILLLICILLLLAASCLRSRLWPKKLIFSSQHCQTMMKLGHSLSTWDLQENTSCCGAQPFFAFVGTLQATWSSDLFSRYCVGWVGLKNNKYIFGVIRFVQLMMFLHCCIAKEIGKDLVVQLRHFQRLEKHMCCCSVIYRQVSEPPLLWPGPL